MNAVKLTRFDRHIQGGRDGMCNRKEVARAVENISSYLVSVYKSIFVILRLDRGIQNVFKTLDSRLSTRRFAEAKGLRE